MFLFKYASLAPNTAAGWPQGSATATKHDESESRQTPKAGFGAGLSAGRINLLSLHSLVYKMGVIDT